MVIPQGNDGSINHAVTVGNGMIFDSTQDYPLTITKESFDFICGDCGCCKIYKTKSFMFKKELKNKLSNYYYLRIHIYKYSYIYIYVCAYICM